MNPQENPLYAIEPTTLCIGETPDQRAVWQNPGGPAFISVHYAKGKQHKFPVKRGQFTKHKTPYTRASLHENEPSPPSA